jgi:peptidoglycan hydrolase CwlO-like protein
MKSNLGFLWAFIFLVIAILAVNSCVQERFGKQRNDKALQAARQDSITVNKLVDSSLSLVDSIKHESDSLKAAIGNLQQERKGVSLDLAKSKINEL